MAAQILVDCASGGTKMYLALQRAETSHVSNTEVGSMPPVPSSLQGGRNSSGSTEPALVTEFRQNLEKAVDHLYELAAGVSPQAVIIGLTAWWRHLDFSRRVEVYELLLKHLKDVAEEVAPCRFEPLSENVEIVLEQEAVAYAARHSLGYTDVDLVVSGGNTSINLVPAGKYQTPATSVGLNILVGQGVVQERGPEVWSSECIVQIDRAAGLYCKELLTRSPAPDHIRVVAIGSNYWGGRDAGLTDSLQEHPLLEVFDRLQARLDARLASRSEGWAKECANLMRLKNCLARAFPSRLRDIVSVVFARDWVVKGEPFRTTWTSGYFIRHAALGEHVATPRRVNSEWVPKAGSPWLDLSSNDSEDLKKVVCFEDVDDIKMHEVPYSSRMQLIDVISAAPLSRTFQSSWGGIQWTRAALSPHAIGREQDGHHVGVQVWLPSADNSSRFVVVGLVSARSELEASALGTLPRPALGFNRRLKDMFPVVDLGIVFDTKAHMVTLQRGAVQMKADTVLGSRDVPWDCKTEASYHVWLEEQGGKVYLRFACNQQIPTAVDSDGVSGWRYDIGKAELVLPAAVHIWVGFGTASRMTRSSSVRPNSPSLGATSSAAWNAVSYSHLERVPGGCSWASGRAWDCFDRSQARVRNCIYRHLPHWVAQSFTRHHVGEDGVRRIAVWPSHGQEPEKHFSFVATAGEFAVWVFNDRGEGLYHCMFEKAKVWSVAILGARRSEHKGSVELRLLIGCVQGERMLHEQLVTVDDPGKAGRCALLERTAAVDEPRDSIGWAGDGSLQGHTEAVTGIFVDHKRDLVYTVSYDKTAIQWDASGCLLHQARGFHREKIYNGALSSGGCWLATAGFDHVALFSADVEHGLSCVALVDHDWENPDLDRRWFATAFLPRTLVQETESTSELPSAMMIGDMHGNMWLVSLLHRDGSRRRPDGMTRFVSAVTDGVSLEPHGDCIRQFCWVEANSLDWSSTSSLRNIPSVRRKRTLQLCSRCGCCRRSAMKDQRAPTASRISCFGQPLTLPLLCSTSSDRTIRLYNASDMLEAYRSLMDSHRTKSQGSTPRTSKVSGSALRIMPGEEAADPVTYAVEIVFHEAPVRAAGVDAFGHLYSASRRLAKWDDLLGFRWGDRVLQPKLYVREAFYLEVVFYFANFLVFALQLLYFSCNRGVFQRDSLARATVSPVAGLTAVTVFESWAFLPDVRPFWRACVSLWVALMVVLCPILLQNYCDAEIKYDLDVNDHNNRNKQWWRKLRCYLFVFVFFGLLVIPTFKEFAVLLYCPLDEHGIPRMAADLETVCFVGVHLAFTVVCIVFGSLYLACGLLFETVNFDLSSLLESKLGAVAAFPTNRGTRKLGDDPVTAVSTRDISLRRLFYVMFRHLSPDINLELPHVSTGVFTQTSWAAHSRHMRFISKVLLAFIDQMGEWVVWQMAAVVAIAVANLLVNLLLPPLSAPQLKWGIVVVQASLTAASGVALYAMTGHASDTPPFVLAVVYVIAVVFPFCLYAFGAPCLSSLRHCKCMRTRDDATRAVAPGPAHPVCLDTSPEAAKVARGGQVAAQPRLAWSRSVDTAGDGTTCHE